MNKGGDPFLRLFSEQRYTAKQRGISWELPYWEWLEIWQQSGHLNERGRNKGEWQMSRPGDIGPYCSSNVKIVRMETNAREAQVTKRRLFLERQKSYRGATEPRQPSTTSYSS